MKPTTVPAADMAADKAAAIVADVTPEDFATPPADPPVAIVGSHIIRESDVQRAMRALTLGDQMDVRRTLSRFHRRPMSFWKSWLRARMWGICPIRFPNRRAARLICRFSRPRWPRRRTWTA